MRQRSKAPTHQRSKAPTHQRSKATMHAFLGFQALVVGAFAALLAFALGDWIGLWS